MATATTPAFACTYDFCNNMAKGILVCIYDDKTTNVSVANRVIYEKAADKSQICAACSTNCTESLCPQPHTPVTIPSTCEVDNLSNDTGDTALWMHNYYRRWNIAAETYKAIESCPSTDPTAMPGHSMNFLRIGDYKLSEQDALKQAIKKWWGELGEKGLGDDTTFHDNSGIKSFANMAYDQADKFACAVQNCQQSGQTLVACQYSPYVFINELVVAEANL
ncbi:SCP-like protein [Ancylostoma duodenale]|uniref:SCP-like protein n=1 Tax=Ancylostoma duodenale TaxID=51022 RepID=A0A0C2CMX9_9BILA|nr:SCP-like protein [Ancylostoma duodenale]